MIEFNVVCKIFSFSTLFFFDHLWGSIFVQQYSLETQNREAVHIHLKMLLKWKELGCIRNLSKPVDFTWVYIASRFRLGVHCYCTSPQAGPVKPDFETYFNPRSRLNAFFLVSVLFWIIYLVFLMPVTLQRTQKYLLLILIKITKI